jgi:predicted HTH domain antitoxin
MAEPIRVSIEGIEDPDARRAATERAREAAILELYRIGQISSGRAAHDLGMSRVAFLELASRHQIPTIQTTADELQEELGSLEP